jgi:hypothetical protein
MNQRGLWALRCDSRSAGPGTAVNEAIHTRTRSTSGSVPPTQYVE